MLLQPRKCQQALPAAPSFPCHRGYQQLLPVGGFDPAYFEGATAILAQVRGFCTTAHAWPVWPLSSSVMCSLGWGGTGPPGENPSVLAPDPAHRASPVPAKHDCNDCSLRPAALRILFLLQACGFDFPACKPGEAIKTGGR